MPIFAEQMKDLTDHLRDSIEGREDALDQVHQATHNLLGAARTFMDDVALEHHQRAEDLHDMLETFRDDLKDKVAEMQSNHRTRRETSREEMRRKLDEDRAARHKTVEEMRHAFAEARNAVAGDLRAAGQVWREFSARLHASKPFEPSRETHHAPPAEEPGGRKTREVGKTASKSKPKGRGK